MKINLPLLMALSLMWQPASWGAEWADLATAVTVTEGYLCAGEAALDGTGSDVKCDESNPYINDDGNIGIGTASPANSLTVVGDISATTINATQLCDENGANCTTLSGGISGVSALASLTDVNVFSPADTATLQWDNSSSQWVAGAAVTGCSAGGADVMPVMTGATTSGYTVTASAATGTHYPWDVFDDSTGVENKWFAGASAAILTIQFPTNTALAKYQIRAANESGRENRLPRDWKFEGSMDGSSWTTLDTQSAITGWVSNGSKTFQFSNTTAYNYYRLNITSDNGGGVNAIGEMELYEVTCSGADDLGDHTATQNLNMGTFDIIGTGDISVTTLNATQLCDENGANCTTLSGGLSGVSALASLTDVSVSTPANNNLLRYNTSTSKWEAVGINDGLSTTTMVPNWPDAIRCVSGSDVRMTYYAHIYASGAYTRYRNLNNSTGDYYIEFNTSDGSYSTAAGIGSFDCANKSISELYNEGKAFNFLGNNGAQISLTEIADVSASAPTDGQLLSYDASENEWVATDVISKTIILNSADDNPCVVTGGVRKLSFNPTTGRLRVCRP